MDINTLNDIISFIGADYQVSEKLPVSGQREVFFGSQDSTGVPCVIKYCVTNPVAVGRIQREIRILSGLKSEYFPKIFYQSFITDSILKDFYDNFDLRSEKQRVRLAEIRSLNIKPFLLTTEERIHHIPWDDCIDRLRNEIVLVELLIHLFRALGMLWEAQVAHRDLKPDNILLRENLNPVIIDLGIAKSFRPGTINFTVVGSPCTPRYAAPEQLTTTRTGVTYKTDQFSIGVIAYLIMTNRFPYGDVCEIGEQILANFAKMKIRNIRDYNSSVNEDLILFIEKLLQVHPYKRFRNVETILQKLYSIRESIK